MTPFAVFKRYRAQLTSLPAFVVYWTLLVGTAMAPYLFFDRIIVPGADAINYFYPAYYWFSESLKQGQSILWNPSFFSGFPTYISQVGGFLEPLNLILFSTLPFLFAYHLRLSLDYVLVMLFSYLAARSWGISKLAAFFIGPMYLLSLHWWYLSTIHFSNSLFVLPFLFWVYMRARNAEALRFRAAWALIGGLGLGWAFLGGYAQFIVYSLTFLGVFAVADFFWLLPREKRTASNGFQFVAVLGIIAVIGAIVGLPQILPSLLYTPISVRGGGLSYNLTQFKVLEWQELVFLFFPDYLRFPFINGGKKALYIGPLFFLFACAVILHIRRNRATQLFLCLTLLAFFLAIPGSYFYYYLHKLPVFELFRFPSRWLFNGIWAFSVLGAFGFDLVAGDFESKRLRIFAVLAGLGTLMLTLFTFMCTFFREGFWGPIKALGFWLFSAIVYTPGMFPKGIEHYQGALERGVDAWRSLASLENHYYTIPFIILFVASLLFGFRVWGRVTAQTFRALSAIILVVSFVGIFAARWPDSILSSTFDDAKNSILTVIPREDLKLYRAHHFHPGYQYKGRHTSLLWSTEDTNAGVALAHELAVPNTNQFTAIPITDGYEPFVSRDLLEVSATLFASTYTSQDILTGVTYDERAAIFLSHLDVLGMMGGKYIISGMEFAHPDLKLVAKPTAPSYETPFYVYEYDKALPRVYLAGKTESVPHFGVMELVDSGKRFLGTTYLDCESCGDERIVPGGTVVAEHIENGYFDIAVDAPDAQWLIISEQFLPGWVVTLDGIVIEPVRANGMYMGISIPAGEHRILAQYQGIAGEAKWLKLFGLFPYTPL